MIPWEKGLGKGCPHRFVYRSISGSEKRRESIRRLPKPSPALRRGQVNSYLSSRLQARPRPSSPAGRILLFLFWTVHGPSSEETPPTPSPPDGEDSALLRSFLLSPQNLRILRGPLCFSSGRKRENGGCKESAIFMAEIRPRPQGRATPYHSRIKKNH